MAAGLGFRAKILNPEDHGHAIESIYKDGILKPLTKLDLSESSSSASGSHENRRTGSRFLGEHPEFRFTTILITTSRQYQKCLVIGPIDQG